MKKITIGLILSVMALAICPIYAECESGEENQPIYCTFDDNGEWICKGKTGIRKGGSGRREGRGDYDQDIK